MARSKPNDKKRDLRLKRIEPKPLIGFLLNPFGTHARSIDYENGVVSVNARRKQNIQVADLSAPPLVTRGFVGSTLNITVDIALIFASRRTAAVRRGPFEPSKFRLLCAKLPAPRAMISLCSLSVITKLGIPIRETPVFESEFVVHVQPQTQVCGQTSRPKRQS